MIVSDKKSEHRVYIPHNPLKVSSHQRGWVAKVVTVTKWQLIEYCKNSIRFAGWVEELGMFIPEGELKRG